MKIVLFFAAMLFSVSTLASPQPGMWNIDAERNGEPGRGFQIDVQGDVLILTVYAYEEDGSPTFYLSSGRMDGNRYTGELLEFFGGTALGGEFRDAESVGSRGDVALVFDSKVTGTVELPNESPKNISRFTFADPRPKLNGTFDGVSYGIGPSGIDSSTFYLTVTNDGTISITREAFFSGTCEGEGTYVFAGTGINAEGRYRCSDFTEGDFVAEDLTVDENTGMYTGVFYAFPDGTDDVIVETHSGM